MFEKLATFAYSNRRRVLFVAVIGAAIASEPSIHTQKRTT